MDELADIVVLLDDERYAAYNITILIVGVPDGVIEYFAKTKNLTSVANRIQEVNKVGGLTRKEVGALVLKGFSLLQYKVLTSHLGAMVRHIHHVTLGVPQRVHEYCEFLAYEVEDGKGRLFRKEFLELADGEWWKQSFRQSYVVLKNHLNSRDTRVARRNQAIYVIGQSNKLQFDSGYLDTQIRKEFPSTVPKTNMGIANILSELSSGKTPLIKKLAGSNDYCASDPLLLVCIRLMLYKDSQTGKVIQKKFQR